MPRAPFVPNVVPTAQKIYLSTAEVAELLGCVPLTACNLIRRGKLPASFTGRGYIVKRTDLDSYLERQSKVVSPRRRAA